MIIRQLPLKGWTGYVLPETGISLCEIQTTLRCMIIMQLPLIVVFSRKCLKSLYNMVGYEHQGITL